MDLESNNPFKKESWRTIISLGYQSLGVVYGDLSTSPLYVYKSAFAEDIQHSETNEEIYGVLCFVFWTLTLIPLLKYVFIILRADDNGEGGTFALYSLLCRHARLTSLPNSQLDDHHLSAYNNNPHHLPHNNNATSTLKYTLEKHKFFHKFLLLLALIGTCMLIGDAVLTPALSVFSAVSGLELSTYKVQHECKLLAKDSSIFTPNSSMFTPKAAVLTAASRYRSASGLCNFDLVVRITTLWYSSRRVSVCSNRDNMASVHQLNWCVQHCALESPCVSSSLSILYVQVFEKNSKRRMDVFGWHPAVHDRFGSNVCRSWALLPDVNQEKIRWPVLGIAILAAVVGSQAVITGTFSIIKQCSALGCFPRVRIIHTSSKRHGQIYIPEINWILMLLCLAVTVGFRDTKHLGNASGLAVITVMLVTTCLMSLVIVLCWRKNVLLAIVFIFFFGTIEALYFSASLIKFLEGAWVPIALSFIFLIIMYVWHYGTSKKYEFDVQNKVPINWLLDLSPNLGMVRVRGIGLIQTELVSGIPAIFSHFVTNLPAFHQVLVFLCIKSVPVPHVKSEERFLIGRIGPKEYHIYRCIARYGYRDNHKDEFEFEKDLVCSIAEFIRSEKPAEKDAQANEDEENLTVVGSFSTNRGVKLSEEEASSEEILVTSELRKVNSIEKPRKRVRFVVPETPQINHEAQEELHELMEARESGMVFILGHSYVRAKSGSSLIKKIAINYGYDFLRRNSRSPSYAISVPHASTLEEIAVTHCLAASLGIFYVFSSCFTFARVGSIVDRGLASLLLYVQTFACAEPNCDPGPTPTIPLRLDDVGQFVSLECNDINEGEFDGNLEGDKFDEEFATLDENLMVIEEDGDDDLVFASAPIVEFNKVDQLDEDELNSWKTWESMVRYEKGKEFVVKVFTNKASTSDEVTFYSVQANQFFKVAESKLDTVTYKCGRSPNPCNWRLRATRKDP
ncbi:hypothetical protein KSS87_010939 [Heliosperma pusillum]|nr:hypothetical protein KSS87_010939 [Heliosperma pusillum]